MAGTEQQPSRTDSKDVESRSVSSNTSSEDQAKEIERRIEHQGNALESPSAGRTTSSPIDDGSNTSSEHQGNEVESPSAGITTSSPIVSESQAVLVRLALKKRLMKELNQRHEEEKKKLLKEIREAPGGRYEATWESLWLQELSQNPATSKLSTEVKRKLFVEGLQAEITQLADAAKTHHLLEILDKKELEAAWKHREEVEDKRVLQNLKVAVRKAKAGSFWGLPVGPSKKLRGKHANKKLPSSTDVDVEAEIGNPKLPQCYVEIKNLLEIQKHPVYAKALQEWTRKEALLNNTVERKKKRVANLKNEVYQLIGFFSVFQGVVLTAVSQSNLLHCNNKWSPISLSVLASFVSIVAVGQKLLQIKDFQAIVHSEEQYYREAASRGRALPTAGIQEFEFAKYPDISQFRKQSRFSVWNYFVLVIGSLICFGALFPVSHWRILCAPGPNPYVS